MIRLIKKMKGLYLVLADRAFGQLYGQSCDLCDKMTVGRIGDNSGPDNPIVTWCLVCTVSELSRWGF